MLSCQAGREVFTDNSRSGIVFFVMPIIKSAIKRVRQAAKRRSHNLQVKRAIHRDVRAFQDALESGDAQQTAAKLREAISEIDRAVKKGTLHRNTAARRKSQLTKASNNLIKPIKAAKPAKPAKPRAAKTAAKKPSKPAKTAK
jgi:small subunit ribosomal protein S20